MIKKTAVIIGASSEIGLETAKRFVKEGYSLALTYNKTKVDFAKKLGTDDFKAYKLDLNAPKDIRLTLTQIAEDFKSLDCLVYCAGVAQKRALILDTTDEEIDTLFEVNIKSAIKCVRDFAGKVVNRNPASIVLVGSFVEKNGCSCESVYTATKGALTALCKSLATEFGNLQIRINVVAPGFIDTKMNNNLKKDEKEEIANMTPLQRLGKTDDVANTIFFLASEQSSFVTGQTIYVDGGLILE